MLPKRIITALDDVYVVDQRYVTACRAVSRSGGVQPRRRSGEAGGRAQWSRGQSRGVREWKMGHDM